MIDIDALAELSDDEYVAATAAAMLVSLRHGRLEVVVDRERCIRQVVGTNAQWYRNFCAAHERRRKRLKRPRTIIKRCDTVSALHRLIDGRYEGEYAQRLMPIVERFWMDYAN